MNHRWPKPAISCVIILLALTLSSACSGARVEPSEPLVQGSPESAQVPPPPSLNPEWVARGQVLYTQHCAECHGSDGKGHPDWKLRNDDGSYNPPPQDATGHTWHHADDLLLDLIATGSDFPQTKMPAFGQQLTDQEILAILEFVKTWWGPEERAFQWQVTWQSRQQ
jgi:mono/diheme cytochrome c family protein